MGIHRVEVVDSYNNETNKRLYKLVYLRGVNIACPWRIDVYIVNRGARIDIRQNYWTLLSTSEYYTEEVAREDFELRRPKMREDRESVEGVPMQRGKRLVQEMLEEKLGKRD